MNQSNLCLFRNLEVVTFNLDRLLTTPHSPSLKIHRILFRCTVLHQITDLLSASSAIGAAAAMSSCDASSTSSMAGITSTALKKAHDLIAELESRSKSKSKSSLKALWEMLCYDALKKLDFDMASRCFIKMGDYLGIHFVERLKVMTDRNQQRPEMFCYFGRAQDAQSMFSKMDDRLQALHLGLRVGDFQRVIHLIKKERNKEFNDRTINTVYRRIGDYYRSRFEWKEALKYYLKSKDYRNAAEAAFKMEDFTVLQQISKQIPSSSNLLKTISRMFVVNGLTAEAATAMIKYGDITSAISCCVELNDYSLAKKLAVEHDHEQELSTMISSKMSEFKGDIFRMIDIYAAISEHFQAAKLLKSRIEKLRNGPKHEMDPFLMKKLYVLSAIQMDKHRKQILLKHSDDGQGNVDGNDAIDLLLEEDVNSIQNMKRGESRHDDNCWNGAMAHHFWILLQRKIMADHFDKQTLLLCRILCSFFDDILPEMDLYSLYALVALKCSYFKDCSEALTRLQYLCGKYSMESERKKYKKLAISVFTKHDPVNDYDKMQCKSVDDDARFNLHNVCMASARYIEDTASSKLYRICMVCNYRTLNDYVSSTSSSNEATSDDELCTSYCPLCHTAFT